MKEIGCKCYVENNHEAIISPEIFEIVQAEIERRGKLNGKYVDKLESQKDEVHIKVIGELEFHLLYGLG